MEGQGRGEVWAEGWAEGVWEVVGGWCAGTYLSLSSTRKNSARSSTTTNGRVIMSLSRVAGNLSDKGINQAKERQHWEMKRGREGGGERKREKRAREKEREKERAAARGRHEQEDVHPSLPHRCNPPPIPPFLFPFWVVVNKKAEKKGGCEMSTSSEGGSSEFLSDEETGMSGSPSVDGFQGRMSPFLGERA